MTLHDVALKEADTNETTMKVSDWLEYYAPSSPVAVKVEQISTSKLDVLDQMYAYYE
ncbi:hypothetical protein [Celeribacter neptunius]|uniref:Uncharacterized protein n=1 Tax=Celeribacter neptunius TaxID=588602 RepID=A0A1I3QL24_9RHOB|nr:hypothetical protein [Celeribacter neptunius]SFJ33991.1 hypothetical protein SAMN04487991_1854 [Celeribacter neptunius]